MLRRNPSCEGVVAKKNGTLEYCRSTINLKMNEELRHYCPVHFYEPTEEVKAPYNSEEYDGYIPENA